MDVKLYVKLDVNIDIKPYVNIHVSIGDFGIPSCKIVVNSFQVI